MPKLFEPPLGSIKIVRSSKSPKYIRVNLFLSPMNLGHCKQCLEGGHMPEILNVILKGIMHAQWKLRSNEKGRGPIRNELRTHYEGLRVIKN